MCQRVTIFESPIDTQDGSKMRDETLSTRQTLSFFGQNVVQDVMQTASMPVMRAYPVTVGLSDPFHAHRQPIKSDAAVGIIVGKLSRTERQAGHAIVLIAASQP